MPVRRAGEGRKTGYNDIRPKLPDDPHHVAQDLFAVPETQGFHGRFGESKIDRAGEELPATVESSGHEQFLGAGHAELFVKLGSDFILPAVAAGHREVSHPVAAAAGKIGDQLGVLVVGVRSDVQHRGDGIEALQFLQNRRSGRGFRPVRRHASAPQSRQRQPTWDGLTPHPPSKAGCRQC